jgi:hypothetical protein
MILPIMVSAVNVTALSGQDNWPNFYGYTAWQSQFAWHA